MSVFNELLHINTLTRDSFQQLFPGLKITNIKNNTHFTAWFIQGEKPGIISPKNSIDFKKSSPQAGIVLNLGLFLKSPPRPVRATPPPDSYGGGEIPFYSSLTENIDSSAAITKITVSSLACSYV